MKYTIKDFHSNFPTNAACLEYLFKTRHAGVKCTHCKKDKFYRHPKRACYTCSCGKTHIFPKNGTIFEKSSTDLVLWFHAIFLMSTSRNGVAAKEIERATGVTYKTAWRMMREIRSVMKEDPRFLSGKVEADETFVGGKKKGETGKANKEIVFAAVERGGNVQTKVLFGTDGKSITQAVSDHVAKGSELLTDGLRAYKTAAKLTGVTHTVDRREVQTVQGFFSQLKRSLDGTYHVISPKYLPSYLSEFQFRWNYGRSSVHLFDALLARV